MNQLVRMLGFPATLIHGDTLMMDRWRWLKESLPVVPDGSQRLLDVGCGSGAYTIGTARRGYRALGLSWDQRNQRVAQERAVICKAPLAEFDIQDVRYLDECSSLRETFDVVVCFENIEHILNDKKLMIDMTRCLKKNGTLFLTTPNFHFIPVTKLDYTPISQVEDGGHVRRGYTPEMLTDLCNSAGLKVRRIEYLSGFFSQKVTALLRIASRVSYPFGWALVLPLRILPPLFDPLLSKVSRWPGYSIALVAQKK
jgi:2-polyprenyl-3-methyl-5-hydroxy-6-metoxy-1,4-benzoquinol methylase